MKNAVYIHGLGGSGNGSSAKNVREALKDKYELKGETYDLLNPMEAFEKIQEDVKGADLIIASSLGGFYASALNPEELKVEKIILLNPCLRPQEVIENILFEEQKSLFNREKCHKEWGELQNRWDKQNFLLHERFAGIFAVDDELFHYKSLFDEYFCTKKGSNSAMIQGTHEIAKAAGQLQDAINTARQLFETYGK